MSTYLLAFVVFEKASFKQTAVKTTADGVAVSTWARAEAVDAKAADLSVTDGVGVLDFFKNWTGVAYLEGNLNKVDQVAVPDFSAGAMENWGLVTYRETALLFDSATGTQAAWKRVSDVIAHELAHQWFGNRVTTAWWNSIWLNEGFANYFECLAMDYLYDKWRIAERFVVDEQQAVFAVDALKSAQPLTVDVSTHEEIRAHFGTITYSKGGSILRMINNFMGEENFKAGIRKYLTERNLQNAEPQDLFDALKNHAPEGLNDTIQDVLESWTTNPGYPVLNVAIDYKAKIATIKQSRFLLDSEEKDATLYDVPVSWAFKSGEYPKQPPTPQEWVRTAEAKVTIEGLKDGDWLLLNPQQAGYYRVNYEKKMWEAIRKALYADVNIIPPVDRAGLLDNAFAVARAAQLDYEDAFRFISYLDKEDDFVAWSAAFNGFSHLHRMLAADKNFGDLELFIGDMLRSVHGKLKGFEQKDDDSHVTKVFRAAVLGWACAVDQLDCRKTAAKMLTDHLENGEQVKPDLQSVVFCYGLKADNGTLWDQVWDNFTSTQDQAQRAVFTTALGCINEKEVLTKYLERSLQETDIRGQDAYTVFAAVYGNPDEGVDVALEFLEKKFADIVRVYGKVGSGVSNIITGLAGRVTTDAQKTKFEKILNDHKDDLGPEKDTAKNTLDANQKWRTKNDKVMEKLKKARKGGAAGLAAMVLPLVAALAALLLVR